MYIMSTRKFSFFYGSPQVNHFTDVTDIVYRRHVINNKVKFSDSEDLDTYFGDPVVGLPKQLLVKIAATGEDVAAFWQRANIEFQL